MQLSSFIVYKLMYVLGHTAQVLRQLAETDTNNRGHCVRLYEAFDYLGHRCLVFDSYALSLRKVCVFACLYLVGLKRPRNVSALGAYICRCRYGLGCLEYVRLGACLV